MTRGWFETAAGESIAVMIIDLNGVKMLNDRFQRAAGDALLASVGERLA